MIKSVVSEVSGWLPACLACVGVLSLCVRVERLELRYAKFGRFFFKGQTSFMNKKELSLKIFALTDCCCCCRRCFIIAITYMSLCVQDRENHPTSTQ